MTLLLAALGFYTNSLAHNRQKIINTAKAYSGKADLLLFGESFLQGFECLSWDYKKDQNIALAQDSDTIQEIRKACKHYQIAISFGFIEKAENSLYSSQLTLGKQGETLHLYRRLSKGWKEPIADAHYKEGEQIQPFSFLGKSFAIGLCGDLWTDSIVQQFQNQTPDAILWPVYTDFNYQIWNTGEKLDYAKQAGSIASHVFYVNSYCLDRPFSPKESLELARGGAVYFRDGEIVQECPAGEEGVLLVEIA